MFRTFAHKCSLKCFQAGKKKFKAIIFNKRKQRCIAKHNEMSSSIKCEKLRGWCIKMKCRISFSAWHTNCRLQISCNSLVQSAISSVDEIATNQSLAAINMYYKRYQKPDKERYRVFKQDCRHITLFQIVCYC